MTNQNDDIVPGVGRASAVLNTAVDAVITIDEHGIIQSINPAAEALFDYEPGVLPGLNVSVLMPEPHRSRHDSYLRAYLESGETRIIGIGRDVEGTRKSGDGCPMHLSVSEFQHEERVFFTGILHDLSARVRMETDLRWNSAFLESIFEHVPDAVIICDQKHKITKTNAAFERMFGYADATISGQFASRLFSIPSEYDQITARHTDTARSQPTEPISITGRRNTDEEFPAELSCSAVRDTSGHVLAYLCIIRDVTQERRRERAVRQLQRVEAIGQLTGGIAHDFNNLLTVIIGNVELLEMRLEEKKSLELAARANQAAEMAKRLTERLLAFARQDRLEPKSINVTELVGGILELVQRTLGAGIEVETRVSSESCLVRVDPSALENAILNLVVNARDAMPTGGQLILEVTNVMVTADLLESGLDLAPGPYVRLSVSDTGTGIPLDVLERVLDPFFSTKETGHGTGLGLSMAYGFAKQSGGMLTIYSEPDRGTTVNVYLPRLGEDAPFSTPSITTPSKASTMSERILVVEDQDDVRILTVERLKELGYEVNVASNAVEAKGKLEGGDTFDLVFSDVVMPGGMTGFDLANWIADNQPQTKVLLTSGFIGDVARRQTSSLDRCTVLRKPYGLAELSATLRSILDDDA